MKKKNCDWEKNVCNGSGECVILNIQWDSVVHGWYSLHSWVELLESIQLETVCSEVHARVYSVIQTIQLSVIYYHFFLYRHHFSISDTKTHTHRVLSFLPFLIPENRERVHETQCGSFLSRVVCREYQRFQILIKQEWQRSSDQHRKVRSMKEWCGSWMTSVLADVEHITQIAWISIWISQITQISNWCFVV